MEENDILKRNIRWIIDNVPMENFELFSVNENNTLDAIAIDLNNDGKFEIVCYDFNGDGEIDRVEYYNSRSNKVKVR